MKKRTHNYLEWSDIHSFLTKFSLLCLSLVFCLTVNAQSAKHSVEGIISDDFGDPLIGASVIELGTTNGTMTNLDGSYKLDVPANATLEFSYVGYITKEVPVKGKNRISIVLSDDEKLLDEVVVTALGIKREKKSLGYSLEEVKGKDLLEARDPNIANNLAGKIAGLDVRQSPSGPAGSSRIVLRGNSSIGGSNQPLIVVDGVPIDAGTGADDDDFFGENLVDRGSGMADISPDDIETMSVLKGPAAAALYGSRAGNGVIMITTKTGKGTKGLGVSYSTNLTIDKFLTKPKYQDKYGQGIGGLYSSTKEGANSWGAEMDGGTQTDYVGRNVLYAPGGNKLSDFTRTGTTWTNSVDIAAADENRSVRLGLSHMDNKAVVPNSSFNRTSATLRATTKLNDKISIDAKATYIHQSARNRMKLGANHDNIFKQFLLMPRSVQLRDFSLGDGGYHAPFRGIVNPYAYPVNTLSQSGTDLRTRPVSYADPQSGNTANPYFSAFSNTNNDRKNRFIGLASIKYDITDWLNVQARYGVDYSASQNNDIQSTGTVFSTYMNVNGNIMQTKQDGYEMNTDFLIGFNKKFLDDRLGVSATAGGSMMYQRDEAMYATANGLKYEYFYTLENARDPQTSRNLYRKKINSLYGTASLSWADQYYLDLSARNDWSSALPQNKSYFYPSVGASWLFSETFKEKLGPIEYGKLRFSWAQVGNDTRSYRTDNYNIVVLGNSSLPTVKNNPNLKNETVTSYEFGLEMSAFNNRIGLDFAFYNKDSKDQIIRIPSSETTGYYGEWINAGKIRNRGIELLLRGTPVTTRDFDWNVGLNFSKNKNKIISLYNDIGEYELSHKSYADQVRILAKVGGQFGDIYGKKFLRDDQGRMILDEQGLPTSGPQDEKLGNASPKWMGGLINQFRYKDFELSFQLDIRYGGSVYMGSYRAGAQAGTLDFTGPNRAEGSLLVEGVDMKGNTNTVATNAQEYWNRLAGPANKGGVAEPWVKDATNLRLRELSFGYNLPKSLLSKTFIRSAKVSFVGRNLWMIHNKVKGYDPEAGFSTGNAQGFEYGSMPTLRSFGFNLNVTF